MIIDKPVMAKDVEFDFEGRFCEDQAIWESKTVICLAHLAEGRVFTCDFKSLKEAKEKGCADADEVRTTN